LEITGRVPIEIPANDHNRRYMRTKREKFGHMLAEFGDHQANEDILLAAQRDAAEGEA
jgi:hypothetical protein